MKTLHSYLFKLSVLLFFVVSPQASLAASLHYNISIDREKYYIEVELSVTDLQSAETMFKLPVWAPGYYLIVNYPKNVVDFVVKDTAGQDLPWIKTGKTGWNVANGTNREVKVTYRIYANAQSVAEAMVKPDKAFVPTNGVLMYVENEKDHPVTVTFNLPEEWKHISTGLDKVEGRANTYIAPNFDVLYDCPVYLGNQTLIPFKVEDKPYQLALETPAGIENTTFVEDLKKMITTTTGMIGHVPYDHYTFILMGAGGGGLEHTNSQACFTSGSFLFSDRNDYLNFFSFITHEFFHLYNVKTIRPIELGPFDYDQEVYTPSLWISEGFTVYYEPLLMRRSGLITSEEALTQMSEWISTIENSEGRKHMSLRQSSYDIWLNFFNRNANTDTRISYYNKGPILGLLMDIEIRRLTKNKCSLDDVMRALYRDFYQDKGRGFTEEEFWTVCASVAGTPLKEMREYVDMTKEIDYVRYLGYAGLEVDMTPLQVPGEGSVTKRSWQLKVKAKCTPLEKAIRESII